MNALIFEKNRHQTNKAGLESIREYLNINFDELIKFLNEDHLEWDFHGIVNVYKTDEKMDGFPSAQCYRIKNDPIKTLYWEVEKGDRTTFSYLAHQWPSGEDGYSGYMLIPLKDDRHFKVQYTA